MGQGPSAPEEIKEFESENTLDELLILEGHTDMVRTACVVNHELVATASDDCTIRLWDWRTGALVHVLEGHKRPITCLMRLSNKRVASGSSDEKICIWNVQTGVCVRKLSFHTGAVQCIIKLGENRLCSGCNDKTLFVWDQDGNEVGRIERHENENLHCMLSVANRIVTGSSSSFLLVYNPETWSFVTALAYHRESVTCLERVNQTQFASGSLDGSIVIWHADTLKPSRVLSFPDRYRSEVDHIFSYHVRSLASLNQRYLVCAVGNGFAVFDLYTGERILDKPDAHDAACLQVLPLYRGRKIVTCSDDATIRLWGAAQELDLLMRQSLSSPSPFADAPSTASPSSAPHNVSSNVGGVGGVGVLNSSGGGGSLGGSGNVNAGGSAGSLLHSSPSGNLSDRDSPGLGNSKESATPFRNLFSSKKKTKINAPVLLGEMTVHSGSVSSVVSINQTTFVSVGADGLAVLWKDGRVQRQLRNNLANASLLSHNALPQAVSMPSSPIGNVSSSATEFSSPSTPLASGGSSSSGDEDVPPYIWSFACTLRDEKGMTVAQVLEHLNELGHSQKIVAGVGRRLLIRPPPGQVPARPPKPHSGELDAPALPPKPASSAYRAAMVATMRSRSNSVSGSPSASPDPRAVPTSLSSGSPLGSPAMTRSPAASSPKVSVGDSPRMRSGDSPRLSPRPLPGSPRGSPRVRSESMGSSNSPVLHLRPSGFSENSFEGRVQKRVSAAHLMIQSAKWALGEAAASSAGSKAIEVVARVARHSEDPLRFSYRVGDVFRVIQQVRDEEWQCSSQVSQRVAMISMADFDVVAAHTPPSDDLLSLILRGSPVWFGAVSRGISLGWRRSFIAAVVSCFDQQGEALNLLRHFASFEVAHAPDAARLFGGEGSSFGHLFCEYALRSCRRFISQVLDPTFNIVLALDLEVDPARLAPGVSLPKAVAKLVKVVADLIERVRLAGSMTFPVNLRLLFRHIEKECTNRWGEAYVDFSQKLLFGHLIVTALLDDSFMPNQHAATPDLDWRRAKVVLAEFIIALSSKSVLRKHQLVVEAWEPSRNQLYEQMVVAAHSSMQGVGKSLDESLSLIVEQLSRKRESEEQVTRTWRTLHRVLSLHRDRIAGCLAETESEVEDDCNPLFLRMILEPLGPPGFVMPSDMLTESDGLSLSSGGVSGLGLGSSGGGGSGSASGGGGGSGGGSGASSASSSQANLMSVFSSGGGGSAAGSIVAGSGGGSGNIGGSGERLLGNSGGGGGLSSFGSSNNIGGLDRNSGHLSRESSGNGGGGGGPTSPTAVLANSGVFKTMRKGSNASQRSSGIVERSSAGSLAEPVSAAFSVEHETAAALAISQRLAAYQEQSDPSQLNLAACGLVAIPDLSKLTLVTSLNLSNNRITSIPASFFSMASLVDLDLSNNQLERLPYRNLLAMRHLKNLNLSGNPFPTPLNFITSGVSPTDTLYFLRNVESFVLVYKSCTGELTPQDKNWPLVDAVLRSGPIEHLVQWSAFAVDYSLNSANKNSSKAGAPRFGRFLKQKSNEKGISLDQLLDKQVLTFGYAENELIPVFKRLKATVHLTNTTAGKIVLNCRAPVTQLATIEVDPKEIVVQKGKSASLDVYLTFVCTTKLQEVVTLEMEPLGLRVFIWLVGQSDLSFELDAKEIVVEDKIGAGGAATVFRGKWRGMVVACKRIMNNWDDDGSFEAKILCQLRHENILVFYGIARQDGFSTLVTEFIPLGSLHRVLGDETVELPWWLRAKFAVDTASALAYLHGKQIIHRDLKSSNLLVNSLAPREECNVKLCDFGIARTVDKNMTLAQGTTLWMAPEVFGKLPYSFKADIWSFGIILGEIVTREEPFAKVSFFEALAQVGKGIIPDLPENTPAPICDLRKQCLQIDMDARPTASMLHQFLVEAAASTPVLKMPSADPSTPLQSPPLTSKRRLSVEGGRRVASGDEIKSLIFAMETGNWGFDINDPTNMNK